MWEVQDREVSGMTPRFPAFVAGWVVVLNPEIGNTGDGDKRRV